MPAQTPFCPVCRQPARPANQPFCSPRCREVDLHRWLAGGYRLPTDEALGSNTLETPVSSGGPADF